MKTLLSFILLFLSFVVSAQNSLGKSDDIARIVLNTYVPADANIKPAAQKLFESKLNAMTRLIVVLTLLGYLITKNSKI